MPRKKIKAWIELGTDNEGNFVGFVEHSFSMGWSTTRVRVNRLYEYEYFYEKGYHKNYPETKNANSAVSYFLIRARQGLEETRKLYPNKNVKLYRVGTKNCPVKIDWREIDEMDTKKMKYDKFKYRNLPFTKKTDIIK